jgi:uncharacterized membrane protein
MDLPSWIIPPSVAIPALLVFAALLGVAAWGAAREPALRAHRYPALLVSVLVLWQLRAVTVDGLALHLLGATLLQLVFGWRLALLGLAAVIAGHTANGAGGWLGFGCNGLLLAAFPVALSHVICRMVTRRAPGNPFAYILIAGFAGGGLSMVAVLTSTTALLLAAGGAVSDQVLDQYALSGILLVFPEAFVTGTIVAWLAMFYPSSVATWTPPWEHAGRG